MITDIVLEAIPRDVRGKNASRRLRADGRIPAAVYGDGKEAIPVSVNAREIGKILRSDSGRNTIFTVEIQGHDSSPVLIKHLALDPVTSKLVHTDLVRISLTTVTRVNVALEFVGTPIGVSRDHGIFDVHLREVEVECLPKDIPEHVQVDVSGMEVGDHVTAGQIDIDTDVLRMVTDGDHMVAGVLASRVEAAPVAEGEAAAGAEPS